jgi:phosphopantetheinyl transferase
MESHNNIQLEIQTSKGVIFIEKLDLENLAKTIVSQKIKDLLTSKLQVGEINIMHLDNGQPYIDNIPQLNISISHSKQWISIYISEDYAVGIDIEESNEKLKFIQNQFVNEREKNLFDTNNLEILQLIWSSKEAIFKYFSGEFATLEKQVSVENIDFENQIIKANTIYGWCECAFEQIENGVYLVWI